MSLVHRITRTMVTLLVAVPLIAQGGRQGGGRTTPPVTPPANAAAQQQARPGTDYQNQPIAVVIQGLAEAGGVSVSLNNMPTNVNTTLRMPGAVPTKAETIAMIKSLAEAHGIKVTGSDALLVLTGPPRPKTNQELQAEQQAALAELNNQKLHTYQLKHSSATLAAQTLTALFQAQGGRGGGAIPGGNNNNGRGAQAQPAAGRGNAGGAAGGGGRGGGGGGRGGDLLSMDTIDPDIPTWEISPALLAAINSLPAGELQDRILNAVSSQGSAGAPVVFQQNAAQNPLQALQTLFGGAGGGAANQVQAPRIIADQLTNKLMILANDADWLKIVEVLNDIDTRPLQVLIEVTIAEVTRTTALNVGMSGRATHKSGLQSDTARIGNPVGVLNATRDFILSLAGTSGAVDYSVALNALASRGDVTVTSMPMLIAQNNVAATLNVGQSIPFPSNSTTSNTGGVPVTQITYNFQDVGTILTITPTINVDRQVNLVVSQTDNSASPDQTFNSGLYIISEREAQTQVFLGDGQTTVLGGLAAKSRSKSSAGIPILYKIPILGPLLFGNKQESEVTTELFLFLTPHIITDDADVNRIRESVKNSGELLKDIPIGKRIKPDTTTVTPPVAGGGGR